MTQKFKFDYERIYKFFERIYKLNRTIVSADAQILIDDVEKTTGLEVRRHKYKTGEEHGTWLVPMQWDIRDAWLKDSKGNVIGSWKEHPLFVAPYSCAIDKKISKKELIEHLYTQPKQPDGLERPRIPGHDIALSATVRPAENWTVTGTARAVLDTTDRISPSYGTFVDVDLADYVLVDARVAYKWNEDTEIYVRGENLLNQKYQVVTGYGMPGIGVFAGVKARF